MPVTNVIILESKIKGGKYIKVIFLDVDEEYIEGSAEISDQQISNLHLYQK